LGNFFGFLRQNARADDQSITAYRIIAKITFNYLVMHHLHISIAHRGRDNVGGVVVNGEPIDFTEYIELAADPLCQCFVALAGLNLEEAVPPFSREMLRVVLDERTESGKHPDKDRAYNVDYSNTIADARIALRTFRTGSRDE
jgi:hypothetical protein